jgi:putative Mn2+ efflux pump MntP
MGSAVSFVVQSVLLGVGLAMDAFSVSLANGMNEPHMKKRRMAGIAGVFGIFQFFMPLIGWLAVHTAVEYLTSFERFVPWIAFGLLLYIGGKMILEGLNPKEEEKEVEEETAVARGTLLLQGVATSIDALSVGFTVASYNASMAVLSSLIIGVVTFVICVGGLVLGRSLGMKLAGKASVLGGVILVGIGIRILAGGI